MRNILLRVILMLFITVFSYGNSREITNLFPEGTKLTGVNAKETTYFFIEDNWKIKNDLEIDIKIFFSELTNPKESSLTFFINGRPLNSVRLNSGKDGSIISGVLAIPKSYIKKGSNEFTIGKTQLLTDGCNIDETNVANWIRIEKSFLRYEYIENNNDITLENFPAPFINKYISKVPKKLNILMSQNPSDDEKLLLANFAGVIGSKNGDSVGDVVVSNLDKILLDGNLKENYVIISEFDNLPKEIVEYYSEKEKNQMYGNVSFKLIKGFKGSDNIILVLSKRGTAFSKNIGSLFYSDEYEQLKGEFSILSELQLKREKEVYKEFRKETMEELGVKDIELSSKGFTKGSFNVLVGRDIEIPGDTTFNVQVTNTPLIEGRSAMLKMRVNGRYIDGVELNNEKRKNEYVVKIPKDILREGQNFLEFELDFSKKSTCDIEPEISVTIAKESYFTVTSYPKTNFELRDLRAPFIKRRKYSDLAISVADDKESLSFLGNLFVFLSTYVNDYEKITYLDRFYEGKNKIIIGNNESNSLINEKWDKLFLPYKSQQVAEFVETTDIKILKDNTYSAIELEKNGESTYTMYIFTDKEREYENVMNQIRNIDFKGDAYVGINLDTSIHRKIKEEAPQIVKRFQGRASKLAAMFFLVFLFFAGSILYFIKKKSD